MKNLVSVIIPTFNRSTRLKEAIYAVKAQSHRPIECIVVDDGSTDDTAQVVAHLKADVNDGFSIVYIKQENQGAQVARNAGTAIASGEYVQYLDSDDIIYPDKIKKQVEYLNQNIAIDGVFGDWEKGTESNKQLEIAYAAEDLIMQFLTDKCIANFSFLMTKKIVLKTGDWDVTIKRNQEIDFHIRAVLAGGKFNYQKQLTGLWKIHDNLRIANSTGIKEIVFFYQKMESLLIKHQLFDKDYANKIAAMHVWYVTQNISSPNDELYIMIKEALRLNKNIEINTTVFKVLSFMLGQKFAAYVWIHRFRKYRKYSL